MPQVTEIARRYLTLRTNYIHSLPVLVLMPHSRCNCRCVMCDIWKANRNGTEITPQQLAPHLADLRRLQVRWVTLSGGEALMHSNLWELCRQLKAMQIRITLLSTGLLLAKHAGDILRWCDEVIVSLDGDQPVHDAIRNVPRAFERLAEGVRALHSQDSAFQVKGRCVLQRLNFHRLPYIINAAREIGLRQISFLAADVSSTAFNRPEAWDDERVADVALSRDETMQFRQIVEETIAGHTADFESGFIAESPEKLRNLVQYYEALNGEAAFPTVSCNAPWVSAVVEADGAVRPCFFHEAYGNIHQESLPDILNSSRAVSFRRDLDMQRDSICRKCVCTLRLAPTQSVNP